MKANSSSLYGIRRHKSEASKKDAVSSSSTLAFTTQLSSLISKESSKSSPPSGRVKPSRSKPDIFTQHRQSKAKRKSVANDGNANQVHQHTVDIGGVDEATLHRSKRRMAEKVKMYEELRRGEYLAHSSDEDDEIAEVERGDSHARRAASAARRAEGNSLIDFDRKWAEDEARRNKESSLANEEDVDETKSRRRAEEDQGREGHDGRKSLVEYEDEFGRTRVGTRKEAEEASRLRQKASQQKAEEDKPSTVAERGINLPTSSRTARPANLIYGATVQSAAFNPDVNIAAQMSHIAHSRDRTPTPPPESHYDPDAEIRSRGTGFYSFSNEEAARKEEMEDLLRSRSETVAERTATEKRKEARDNAKVERQKKIAEFRAKRRAEEFLNNLGGDFGGLPDVSALGGEQGREDCRQKGDD